jgi:hypothetical protein
VPNPNVNTANNPSQGQLLDLIVELRRRDASTSKIKAHADVEIRFGSLGSILIFGFSVFEPDGKPPVVLPPAQKGERKSFPHVKLSGKVKSQIESAILREYQGSDASEDV